MHDKYLIFALIVSNANIALRMKITVLLIGKTTEKHVSEGIDIYINRIKRYCKFEIITIQDIKNTKNMPESEQKIKEGKKILDLLSADDYCVLLDEHGVEYNTLELSEWLNKRMSTSTKNIYFVIGGPYGFSDEVYARSDFKLALSRLTFPHQLVRLLFMEQLYRTFTVIKGEPYHHE